MQARSRCNIFAIAIALLAVACAARPRTSHDPSRRRPAENGAAPHSAPSAPSAVAMAQVGSPPLDALQERRLAEMDRVLSWRSTVFANGQPPLRPARLPASGPLPYRAIASARAFGFGLVRSLENECGYHERGELAPPSDDALPFAPDGTLCPDASPPSEVLSASDLEAVLNGLRTAEAEFREHHSVVRFRCGFDAHHALVFYDKPARPFPNRRGRSQRSLFA